MPTQARGRILRPAGCPKMICKALKAKRGTGRQDLHASRGQPHSAAVSGSCSRCRGRGFSFLFSPFHARLGCRAQEAPSSWAALASRRSQPRGGGEGLGAPWAEDAAPQFLLVSPQIKSLQNLTIKAFNPLHASPAPHPAARPSPMWEPPGWARCWRSRRRAACVHPLYPPWHGTAPLCSHGLLCWPRKGFWFF